MFSYRDLRKILFLPAFILICMLMVWSCGDRSGVDSQTAAQVLPVPKTELTKERDQRLLLQVVEINYREILAGKLARQRATDPSVKDLAAMLEDAHREAKSSLASLAITEGIAIPGSPAPKALAGYDLLNEEPVEEFDVAYCTLARQDHEEAIALLESAIQGHHDPDIQAWASSMLPALRIQLAKVEVCASQLNPISALVR